MTQELTLTTGIYDLIKDQIRRKKVSSQEEEVLKVRLKNAVQLTRKNLPEDVVTIDAKTTIKNHTSNQEESYTFVAPDKAKRRNNTESIISPMGLAIMGTKVGDKVKWQFDDKEVELEILNVERIA